MEFLYAYLSLFGVSFLAATLLPAYSEILFATLMAEGHEPWVLWLFATSGNTLGSVVNWAMGRYLLHYQDRRWFPFKSDSLGRSQRWFNRYGVWSLLMAWAPIGGDALTFIAGIMRVNFLVFVTLTAIGKGLRYAAIVGLLQQIGFFW